MGEITAPGDAEDEQRTYTKLLTAINEYRRRRHRAGPEVLGPRPAGLDGEDWDHLISPTRSTCTPTPASNAAWNRRGPAPPPNAPPSCRRSRRCAGNLRPARTGTAGNTRPAEIGSPTQ
ncbi:hypothetical protein GCM10010300_80200 [Streptomyces olivaceoviridis]|uniref:hypothetical protein n=1 Tax=Streptomyces olivaceoviridis TaxID=1921 RepID=UPI0019CB77CC|nr:hypothetical protein [Streptomyces olivaceoviridis]GGZ24698.1 hypothetical protein GCM10010300_80200 [Streptomyces olivaceoviridis]